MAIAAVFAANMYNGLNTRSWTWWVFGGVLFGPVIILIYTAVYNALPPSLIWTTVYGYNIFLWPSAYFWLGTLFTIVLSLIPRYLYRFVKEVYFPSDVDILGWTDKVDPKHDWINDEYMPRGPPKFEDYPKDEDEPAPLFTTATRTSTRHSVRQDAYALGRVSTQASMTHDMSTGATREGAGRGYGFDQADNMLPVSPRFSSATPNES